MREQLAPPSRAHQKTDFRVAIVRRQERASVKKLASDSRTARPPEHRQWQTQRGTFEEDFGTGCAARTSKSLSLRKSRPERSSRSDNAIDLPKGGLESNGLRPCRPGRSVEEIVKGKMSRIVWLAGFIETMREHVPCCKIARALSRIEGDFARDGS
jgi:hypothetical protein